MTMSPHTCLLLCTFACSFACMFSDCARGTISADRRRRKKLIWIKRFLPKMKVKFSPSSVTWIFAFFVCLHISLHCCSRGWWLMSVLKSDVRVRIVICGNALAARLLLHPNTRNQPTFQIYHSTMSGLDWTAQNATKVVCAKISKAQSRWNSPAQCTWLVCHLSNLTHLLKSLTSVPVHVGSAELKCAHFPHFQRFSRVFRKGATMGSVWKRLNRINKRAAKFHFTASYSELWLEVKPPSLNMMNQWIGIIIVVMLFIPWSPQSSLKAGPNWQPTALSVIWTRKSRWTNQKQT